MPKVTLTDADVSRLQDERARADRAYNDALTGVDQAVTPPSSLPAPPPLPDDHQIGRLNTAWEIVGSLSLPAGGWNGRSRPLRLACGRRNQSPSPAPGQSVEPVALTVGLGYIPSVQFAQFYLADEAGYYAEAGLDVTFEHFDDPSSSRCWDRAQSTSARLTGRASSRP